MATSVALLPLAGTDTPRVPGTTCQSGTRDQEGGALADLKSAIERLRREREVLFAELRRVCSA